MRSSCLGWAAIVSILLTWSVANAADPAAVHNAIQKGGNSLIATASTWNIDAADQGYRSLAALALVKGHFDPNTAAISTAVQAAVARCTAEGYKPAQHHYYLAGVDASLLVEAGTAAGNPQMYQAQLQMIADYIMAGQLDHGGWDYPEGHGYESTTYYVGDTSVIQYCMLGLWAATRAGVQVPNSVFERCISWHMTNQQADGGFNYCPGLPNGPDQGLSSLNMTAAGMGSVMIAAMHLYPDQYDKIMTGTVVNPTVDMPEVEAPFGGILEEVDLDEPAASAEGDPLAGANGLSAIPITDVKGVMDRAMAWMGPRFVAYNSTTHSGYYYYTVERTASLAHVTHIGQFEWYHFCGDHLISIQKPDGSWSMTGSSVPMDTAFAILFLALSTGQIVTPDVIPSSPDLAGVGQQQAGRYLPEDLSTFGEEGAVNVAENLGATNDLLAALANPENIGDLDIADVQQAIVEEIQLGENREEWIGRKDELAALTTNTNPEVRRTAIWALGRTGDMSLAKLLITALEDPDVSVNIEANNALCWLSRRPNGFNISMDPLAGLPAGAGQDQVDAVLAAWREDAVQQWGTWYLRHRPFADRGDEFEANLRQRLGR